MSDGSQDCGYGGSYRIDDRLKENEKMIPNELKNAEQPKQSCNCHKYARDKQLWVCPVHGKSWPEKHSWQDEARYFIAYGSSFMNSEFGLRIKRALSEALEENRQIHILLRGRVAASQHTSDVDRLKHALDCRDVWSDRLRHCSTKVEEFEHKVEQLQQERDIEAGNAERWHRNRKAAEEKLARLVEAATKTIERLGQAPLTAHQVNSLAPLEEALREIQGKEE